MKVLTTFKTKAVIKEDMEKTFPKVNFSWKESIEKAEPELHEAEVLITYGVDLTEEHIEKANKLKWIMVVSAGVDDMPLEKIAEKGISVTNARGISAGPMGEYAIAMLLQVERKAKELYEKEKAHEWSRAVKMVEISGKTMLIAGTGAIGQEVARLAKAFHMKTIGISKSGRSKEHFDETYTIEELNTQLGRADYVINVLPATTETEKVFGTEQFDAMHNEAIFLNMGRGTTVDEKELIDALKQEKIQHAILDVMEEEPLNEHSPLWSLENTTITPHLSGISRHYQPRGFEIFKKNLDAYLKNEKFPLNQIDARKGY
ncbi:D-2-hydroxyacid dehydrogenase [Allobacillus sp. GCM10007491]|uniref:D-2-hydroxyacid dehydrogenase n=1 Tax=Allobacillus saliphilus TaxID=2912308 RepID=A0A941CV85_9BACI|nr:D-2-hydroxyacid dehydrogenase [Allobacillus saliphilus]MBR7554472.1 D-2-hydroxyacid dehydrogenase [Allobacillus saliphilus]